MQVFPCATPLQTPVVVRPRCHSFLRRRPALLLACVGLSICLTCSGCGRAGDEGLGGSSEAARPAEKLAALAMDHYENWAKQARRDAFRDPSGEFGPLSEYTITAARHTAALLNYARGRTRFSCLVDPSGRQLSDDTFGVYVMFISTRSWFSNLTLPDSTMQRLPLDIQIDQDPVCILSRSCDPETFPRAVTDHLPSALAWDRNISEEQRTEFADLLPDMDVTLEYLDVRLLTFRRTPAKSPGTHVEEFQVILTPGGKVLGARVTSEISVEGW